MLPDVLIVMLRRLSLLAVLLVGLSGCRSTNAPRAAAEPDSLAPDAPPPISVALPPALRGIMDTLAISDPEVLRSIARARDSLNARWDSPRGLPVEDAVALLRQMLPAMFCSTDLFTACVDNTREACLSMYRRGVDRCLAAQQKLMPEFITSREQGARIGAALGGCAGQLYGAFYDDRLQESTDACREQLRALGRQAHLPGGMPDPSQPTGRRDTRERAERPADREANRADCLTEEVERPRRRVVVLYVNDHRQGALPLDGIDVDPSALDSITVVKCEGLFEDPSVNGVLKLYLKDKAATGL